MNKVINWIAAIGAISMAIFIIHAIMVSSFRYHASGFYGWVGRLSGEGKLLLLVAAPFVGALLAGVVAGAIVIALGETIFKRLFKD